MAFHYFSETDQFKFKDRRKASAWLKQVILNYHKVPGDINFIFCTDQQLLEINQTYLKHFYLTDVITFNYNQGTTISGDIYISTDRISDNAEKFSVTFEDELRRVMVHGVLHLIGFDDKTASQRKEMQERENFHLKEI